MQEWQQPEVITDVTLTYSSADSPVFVASTSADLTSSISPGMRLRVSQTTGGVKYFIVVGITSSTVTLYGGTDYSLANETISNPVFSSAKAPVGFPLDPSKWTVEVTNSSDQSQTNPTAGTWYNLGSLSIIIPIGIWAVSYQVAAGSLNAGADQLSESFVTLSTANNSESDPDLTGYNLSNVPNFSGPYLFTTSSIMKILNITSKTTYYLNTKTNLSSANTHYIQNLNSKKKLIIRAICAYL